MRITDLRRGPFVVASVEGELNAACADIFLRHCLALIEGGESNLVLDFTTLKYLSSAGLRAILSVEKKRREAGGVLALCSPSEHAAMVLQIAGLFSQLTVYPSLDHIPDRIS